MSMSSNGAAVAALTLTFSSMAWGQAPARPADPTDARTGGNPVRYESAFSGYRPYTDEKVVSWRATNDLVQKLGGWQAFARDKVPDIPPVTAPLEDPARKSAAPLPAPAKKPDSGGHAGHH